MGIRRSRAASRRAQLAAVLATSAVLSGVAVAMAGALEGGLTAAVRGDLDEPSAALVVSSADPDEVADAAAVAFGAAPLAIAAVDAGVRVAPDPARVAASDLPALRDGARALPDVLVEAGVASRTAVAGDLAAWAGELDDAALRTRLLALVPALLVLVAAIVASRDVVRVLELSRVREAAVAVSRGASRRFLLAWELREIAAAAVLGAVVGAVSAALLAGAVPPVAAIVALGIVVLLVLVAIPVVTGLLPRGRADEAAVVSGRGRVAGVVALVLLAAATALALARATTAGAGDPIAVLAPALGVVAAGGLALGVVAVLARVLDGLARGWRGLGPALAVRRVARRLPLLASAVLLVAVAAATSVFAAAFAATGERLADTARAIEVGSDVRIVGWPATEPIDVPADAVGALLRAQGEIGDSEPLLLAGAHLADVVRPVPGAFDARELAAATASAGSALALPEDTTGIAFDVAASEGVAARAWIADAAGRVRSVPIDAPTTIDARALLAVDADLTRAGSRGELRVSAVLATTPNGVVPVPVPGGWRPQFAAYPDLERSAMTFPDDAAGFEVARTRRDEVAVRLMPAGEAGALPAAVTAEFAARNGLETGDALEVRFAGTGRILVGQVAAVVPALPAAGDRDAVLVDLPAFAEQQLRVEETLPAIDEAWARTSDPDAVVAAAPDGVTVQTLATGVGERMLSGVRALLWIAAAGSVAAAAIALAGVSAALVRERRREVRVLAVLGATPARQAAGERLELALSTGLALVAGAAGGAAVAVVAVRAFALAATPGAGAAAETAIAVDPLGAGLLLGALAVAIAVVVLVHGARVARPIPPTGEAS